MTAQNGIIGSGNGIDLPVSLPDQNELKLEKAMARYAGSAEFKRLVEHFQDRVAFYQTYLPDGTPVAQKTPTPAEWQAANIIIAELNSVMQSYALAQEAVKNAEQ